MKFVERTHGYVVPVDNGRKSKSLSQKDRSSVVSSKNFSIWGRESIRDGILPHTLSICKEGIALSLFYALGPDLFLIHVQKGLNFDEREAFEPVSALLFPRHMLSICNIANPVNKLSNCLKNRLSTPNCLRQTRKAQNKSSNRIFAFSSATTPCLALKTRFLHTRYDDKTEAQALSTQDWSWA